MIQNNPNQINEIYSGEWKLKEMKRFIKSNLIQLIAEYDLDKEFEINRGKYSLLAIVENEEIEKQTIEELHKVADSVK